MVETHKGVATNPRHAFLLRGKDGEPLRMTGEEIRRLVSPLEVRGEPDDAAGARVEAYDVVATVRQIRQGIVVTLSPEMAWEEFSELADPYLGKLGAAVGRELEVVEL